MLFKLRSHVRHNLVGYLALFFALTGVAYAAGPLKSGDPAGGDLTGTYPDPSIAGSAVNGAKVGDGSLTDADVATANKDGTAGTPSLRTLGTAAQQAMPGNATPGGPPSGSAGGDLTGTYPDPQLARQEDWHEVSSISGFSVCAPLGSLDVPWQNTSTPADNTAGFFRDEFGIVHLKGRVNCGINLPSTGDIFTLPPGYRPAKQELIATVDTTPSGDPVLNAIVVETSGAVHPSTPSGTGDGISLDGIAFRCPSGANGCP